MNTKVLITLFVDQWEKNIEQFTFNNGKISLFWDYSDYFLNQKFLFSKHLKFQQRLSIFLVPVTCWTTIWKHRQHSEQEDDFFSNIVCTFLWGRPCLKSTVFSATWKFTDFLFIIYRIIWTVQSFNIHILYSSSSVSIYIFVYTQITIIYCFPIPVIFFFEV